MKAFFEFTTGADEVKPELDNVGMLFAGSSTFVEPKLNVGVAKLVEFKDGFDSPNENFGTELVFNEPLWVVTESEIDFISFDVDCDVWGAENAKPPSLGDVSVVFELTIVLFGDVRLFGIVNDDADETDDAVVIVFSFFAGSFFA